MTNPNPNHDPAFTTVPLELTMPVGAVANAARQMLAQAEQRRREKETFDATAHPNVDADWAAAGVIIEAAVLQLNESLPNAQPMRTSCALGALMIGVTLLKRALGERGVNPQVMGFLPPPPAEMERAPAPAKKFSELMRERVAPSAPVVEAVDHASEVHPTA